MSWYPAPGRAPGQRAAAYAQGSTGTASERSVTECEPKIARTLTARHDSSPCADRGQNIIAIPINDKATRYSGGGPTRNEDGSGNGLGIGKPGDPAPTLSCGDRHAVAVSAGFVGQMGAKAGNIGYQEEMAPTLKATQPSHVVCYDARGNGDGSTAATLAGDHQRTISDFTSLAVMPFDTTQCTSPQNGNNPHYGDPCHPLAAAAHAPAICIDKAAYNSGENSSYGFQVDVDLSPTITSRQPPVACYQKTTGTLTSKMAKGTGGPAGDECQNLVIAGLDCRNGRENGDLCGTLQAKPNGGFSYNCIHPVRIGFAVRRLTPLECERLQGYPDGWTDIPGASDSARYKALGNSVAVPCVAYIMRGIAEQLDR